MDRRRRQIHWTIGAWRGPTRPEVAAPHIESRETAVDDLLTADPDLLPPSVNYRDNNLSMQQQQLLDVKVDAHKYNYFLKNGPNSASFLFIFRSFHMTNIAQIL